MRTLRVRRQLVRLIAAGALAGLILQCLSLSVAAASATFGANSVSSKFGDGITFTQSIATTSSVKEADIVLMLPGDGGPSLTKIESPGSSSLTYKLDASSGGIQPNTMVTAHFQLTFSDGTVLSGPDIHVTYNDDRFTWKTMTGKLLRVHWYQGSDSFAQQALNIGELGIEKAAAFMGVTEKDPIDFFIYPDQTPFYDALGPGTRDNVGGEANTTTRTLFALIAPNDLGYAATVVPHELTHVVFDDATTNPYHFPPHWLNEGVAVYLSQGYGSSDRSLVAQAASNKELMPLGAIVGQFPTTQDRFFLAYAESVSAVDFFMRKYGKTAMVKLIDAFGAGISDDEAFRIAIGTDLATFDKAWMASNGITAYPSYGPQPAPAGAVPPGWTTAGGSPATSPGASAVASPGDSSTATASNGRFSRTAQALLVAGLLSGVALVLLLLALVVYRREHRDATP